MSQIHSRALATLVAFEGSHWDVPFSRLHSHAVLTGPGSQGLLSTSQMTKNIHGLRLITALPSLSEKITPFVRATKAWSMQEVELSHASIFFGGDQVFFRCAQKVFLHGIHRSSLPGIGKNTPRMAELAGF